MDKDGMVYVAKWQKAETEIEELQAELAKPITEHPDVQRLVGQVVELQAENERLKEALEKSVKLQSHYAVLLNQYDGGERMIFTNAAQWMSRLQALKGE